MPKNSYKFYSNRDCIFFPCHDNIDEESFNCLFCYCPLILTLNCGGNYTITKDGIKDCSQCTLPHLPDNYKYIIEKLKVLLNNNKLMSC